MSEIKFNNNLFFNPARTCAVTGHRELPKDFNKKKLKIIFEKIIQSGYDTFLIGMALGFDTICFDILQKLKKTKQLKIVACVPCISQSFRYNKEQKIQYDKMLELSDEKILISEDYTPYCMFKRNRYMVDNSSVLIAYVTRQKTGSSYTRNYAVKKQIPVIDV